MAQPVPFSQWDLLAMAKDINPASVRPDGVPSLLAKDMSAVPEETKQNFMPPSMKLGSQASSPVMGGLQSSPEPQDYEAQIQDLYRKGLDDRGQEVGGLKSQLSQLGERPSGFKTLDLSPLAAFVDSTTGSNLSQGYKGPTLAKEYDQKKALLQQALAQGQDKLTDDQLNFLKMKTDERKNDEAMRLREMMMQQRGQNSDDNQEGKLRKEYMSNPLYKQMGEINKAYQGIEANKADTGPAQQALVYQFSRILDPGSVVRETEYAMSAANMGKINQASMYLDALKKGTPLSPDQIKYMKDVSRELVLAARHSLDAHNSQYRELAKRKGIAPENIIMDSFYGAQGGGQRAMSDEDKAAVEWAKANPNDPRAKQILGVM